MILALVSTAAVVGGSKVGMVLTMIVVGLVLGMAISTQDITLARQRAFHAGAMSAGQKNLMLSFFGWLANQKGKPDLQVKEFAALTGSDTVIADAACNIFAILLKKLTTTTAYFKGSDSASASSSTAPEIELRQQRIDTVGLYAPKGIAMANGFTISSDTTSDGNTGSSAGDGATGVVILGAPAS